MAQLIALLIGQTGAHRIDDRQSGQHLAAGRADRLLGPLFVRRLHDVGVRQAVIGSGGLACRRAERGDDGERCQQRKAPQLSDSVS